MGAFNRPGASPLPPQRATSWPPGESLATWSSNVSATYRFPAASTATPCGPESANALTTIQLVPTAGVEVAPGVGTATVATGPLGVGTGAVGDDWPVVVGAGAAVATAVAPGGACVVPGTAVGWLSDLAGAGVAAPVDPTVGD